LQQRYAKRQQQTLKAAAAVRRYRVLDPAPSINHPDPLPIHNQTDSTIQRFSMEVKALSMSHLGVRIVEK
jgi:hypothetical protein